MIEPNFQNRTLYHGITWTSCVARTPACPSRWRMLR